jgi:hypothetical protein
LGTGCSLSTLVTMAYPSTNLVPTASSHMPNLEYSEGLGSHALTTIRTMHSRECLHGTSLTPLRRPRS